MVRESLEPGCLYHIYNHAVGKDNLFLSDDNYYYFLRRYSYFISPIASTFAYCLMPNHIHFLIRINQEIAMPDNTRYTVNQFISKQFSNLFSSYSQAFNKQQNRRGNLFISNFRRKQVDTNEYLTALILYIHNNPVNHRFTSHAREWKFSSYNSFFSNRDPFLDQAEVIRWFGNLEEFKKSHSVEVQLPESLKLSGS